MNLRTPSAPSRPMDWLDQDDQAAIGYVAANPGSALCTIVGMDGSFSRKLGAQLAVGPAGEIVGSLADGCLERELVNQVAIRRGEPPAILRFGKNSPFIDFRLPCGAGLDILIDTAPDRRAIERAVAALTARQPAALKLPVPAGRYLETRHYVPPLRLLLFGVGPELDWMARLAAASAFMCEVARPGGGLSLGQSPANCSADAWTAIALLFHDHEWEGAILDWCLSTKAFFIGAIGGANTRRTRLAHLESRGWEPEQIMRVRGPVGLIPRARDPRVLAFSILSEIIAEYERFTPR